MSSIIHDEEQLKDIPPFPVRRWSVEEYHALIRQGIFEDERVELLQGWIVSKMTRNPPHDATVALVDQILRPAAGDARHLRIQSALSLEGSEPEPDLALVKGSPRDYRRDHPGEDDTLLVVEVSDASLRKDRQKATIYAQAGIPAYWIVNLAEQQLEVFSDPDTVTGSYRQLTILESGSAVPVSIPGQHVEIRVEEIFPQE